MLLIIFNLIKNIIGIILFGIFMLFFFASVWVDEYNEKQQNNDDTSVIIESE